MAQRIVFGYKGKQVRDNIHSHHVVRAIEDFAAHPRPGEVYNLRGGSENSISMLEAIAKIEQVTSKKAQLEIRRRKPQGRPYLLHFEFRQIPLTLSQLVHHHQPRRNPSPDHCRPYPAQAKVGTR